MDDPWHRLEGWEGKIVKEWRLGMGDSWKPVALLGTETPERAMAIATLVEPVRGRHLGEAVGRAATIAHNARVIAAGRAAKAQVAVTLGGEHATLEELTRGDGAPKCGDGAPAVATAWEAPADAADFLAQMNLVH